MSMTNPNKESKKENIGNNNGLNTPEPNPTVVDDGKKETTI